MSEPERVDLTGKAIIVVRAEMRNEEAKALADETDLVVVVLSSPGDSLEALDEEQMREAGWVRA